MRILHLLYESQDDPFGIGGVGIRAYEIYRYLQARHDVTLLCKKYRGAKDDAINGIQHVFVGAETDSFTRTVLSYTHHAVRFVRKSGSEFDIIVEEFSPALPTFLHAFSKRPVVLQVQGYTGIHYFRKYNPVYASVLASLEQLRPRFYDTFIFPGDGTRRRFSLPKKSRWEIIPNGVPEELLDTDPVEESYILYLGRLEFYGKGLDLLIDAYEEFQSAFPGVGLVLAGDGRDKTALEKRISGLPDHVRSQIEMPGWVSGDVKREVLRRALFCVFPSRHEVHPISVLEAMACAKALVASSIEEFRFIREHAFGLTFETGNAAALAVSMKNLMINPERTQMGERARAWVKELTWDKVALKYEDFLRSVLEADASE